MIHEHTVRGFAGVGLIDVIPSSGGTGALELLLKTIVGVIAVVPTVKQIIVPVINLFKKKKKSK